MTIKIGNRYLQSVDINPKYISYQLSKTPIKVDIPVKAITHMVEMMAKGHMTKQNIEVTW